MLGSTCWVTRDRRRVTTTTLKCCATSTRRWARWSPDRPASSPGSRLCETYCARSAPTCRHTAAATCASRTSSWLWAASLRRQAPTTWRGGSLACSRSSSSSTSTSPSTYPTVQAAAARELDEDQAVTDICALPPGQSPGINVSLVIRPYLRAIGAASCRTACDVYYSASVLTLPANCSAQVAVRAELVRDAVLDARGSTMVGEVASNTSVVFTRESCEAMLDSFVEQGAQIKGVFEAPELSAKLCQKQCAAMVIGLEERMCTPGGFVKEMSVGADNAKLAAVEVLSFIIVICSARYSVTVCCF
ncbi:hypothetical protein T492DRAFT_231526 [Pavlovales sp. CCMP2436]|nr:hypothetical protein T492DRAFT_231526 [Pavlovales sp. CCMP2436]